MDIGESDLEDKDLMISVVLPCRNEEQCLGDSIEVIKQIFSMHNIKGEIIVSDSSVDSSPSIARKEKVILHKHDKPGYGVALLEGFSVARGKYIFFADPDGSYDFKEIPRFVNYLDQGYELIIGNRFMGKIDSGVMPWMHRYVGNPLLSGILRMLFSAPIRDAHCGMRAFPRAVLSKLNFKTSGMEFASEMVIQAVKYKLKIKEIPINYHQRKGQSKLRTFSDGWRHLRFMLFQASLNI